MISRQETHRSNPEYPTYQEAIDNLRTLPTYGERLEYALAAPLLFDASDYEALPANRPTPLDTSKVFVSGCNEKAHVERMHIRAGAPLPYREYALRLAEKKALQVGKMPGHVLYVDEVYAEATAQVKNRCDHNAQALERLKHLLIAGTSDHEAPQNVLEIIMRLRAGTANLPEMLDIIKRYPAMGSIETSNFMRFFDNDAIKAAVHDATVATEQLGTGFADAQLEMDTDIEAGALSNSSLVPGAKVQKTRLGRLLSVNSDTEHMLKTVYMRARGRLVPCGISTYLRPTNYKALGLPHEAIDDLPNIDILPPVDVHDVELDETARRLEGEARDHYLQALYGAAQRHINLRSDY